VTRPVKRYVLAACACTLITSSPTIGIESVHACEPQSLGALTGGMLVVGTDVTAVASTVESDAIDAA
jgi:hypothetical protein